MQQQTTSLAFAETEPLEQRSRPERMTTVQLEEKASEIKSAVRSFCIYCMNQTIYEKVLSLQERCNVSNRELYSTESLI